ncbi:putative proline iminopeptidase [Venturia inaequalis]|nr:putative proline iminopeptidase [Venturia inaequalis]
MSGDNQLLQEKVTHLLQEISTARCKLEQTTEQLQVTKAALKAARADGSFPWKRVSVVVIFLVICILSAKGDERARVDGLLDRVVSMSRAFEQIKSICEAKYVAKTTVQTILSIVAATNTTGAF